jgi:hypothetical protein
VNKCDSCGRQFKNPQALGGHVKNKHSGEGSAAAAVPAETNTKTDSPVKPEAVPVAATPASAVPAKTKTNTDSPVMQEKVPIAATPEEGSEAEQIRRYHKLGYSFEQLKAQFGFKDSTIRQELEKAIQPEEPAKKYDSNDDGLPVIRKMGGGMETITPEAVLRRYMDGGESDKYELRGMMKLRAAMLMVMDLVNIQKSAAEADARRIEPMLKLMQETREEQDAAAARAKSSSEEIAARAAEATAGQLYAAITQNNSQVNTNLERIKQMVGGQSEDPFSKVVSMMQSMQQMSQMFGMPMPGMPGNLMNPNDGQGFSEPLPIERHSINELEGK